MQVTIDTSSREEAELVARLLPRPAEARSVRGYGFVRLRCRNAKERNQILEAVKVVAAQHTRTPKRIPTTTPQPPRRPPNQRKTRVKKYGSAPIAVNTPMSRFFS